MRDPASLGKERSVSAKTRGKLPWLWGDGWEIGAENGNPACCHLFLLSLSCCVTVFSFCSLFKHGEMSIHELLVEDIYSSF